MKKIFKKIIIERMNKIERKIGWGKMLFVMSFIILFSVSLSTVIFSFLPYSLLRGLLSMIMGVFLFHIFFYKYAYELIVGGEKMENNQRRIKKDGKTLSFYHLETRSNAELRLHV